MSDAYIIDQSRWNKLDIFNQMGNIYSEVGRAFKSQNRADKNAAIARAIELFDATALALSKKRSPKLKEVLRAKEQFLDIIFNENSTNADIQSLDNYFLHFAVAARLASSSKPST